MSKELVDLSGLMAAQVVFETTTRGIDQSMAENNTPEFILKRGIIGEAEECLEALDRGAMTEAKMEAIDLLIFTSALFVHLEMDAEEVAVLAEQKMLINFYKYNGQRFDGVTLEEGIRNARDHHADLKAKMYAKPGDGK